MAAERLRFTFLAVLLNLISFSIIRRSSANNVAAMFIFGDSIFDSGNNRFNQNCSLQADFPPYGSTFFHHPTGRFTNGRTVPDFISEFLDLPLQKPFMEIKLEIGNGSRKNFPTNGINFASAGSGVFPATNQDFGVTPIQAQLQQFTALLEGNQIDEKLVRKSLFLFESGANDIFTYFNPLSPPTLTPQAYIQSMLAQVQTFFDTILNFGAQRVVLFAVGPVGCVPARALLPGAPLSKCHGRMNKMVKDYNVGLENIVTSFRVKYPHVVVVFGAVYKAVQIFRADPKSYGFSDVENACCGNGRLGGELQCGKEGYTICKSPNHHLFWDLFHPSERTYQLISKALWAGGPNSIRPFNLKQLSNITISSKWCVDPLPIGVFMITLFIFYVKGEGDVDPVMPLPCAIF